MNFLFSESPKVTITPQKTRIKIGEPAKFTCIASGSPLPKLKWRKLNGSLPVNGTVRGGAFSIANVSQEDAGIYICEASNVEGSAKGNGTLEIKGIKGIKGILGSFRGWTGTFYFTIQKLRTRSIYTESGIPK